ncbi:hypothetical protein VPH35_082994 [Triticum aestivum]
MESTVILNGLITSVSSSLAGVIVRVACVKKDVDTLTGRLESIMAVIGDAERHRILARSEAADHRLKKLREIAYEAETIIDLFRIEVGTSRSQVSCISFFSPESSMQHSYIVHSVRCAEQ